MLSWGHERKLALALMFAGLTVALSPIFIPVGPTRALPWQHMTNALCGVLLGPWWGIGVALIVSLVRNMLGLGTIYAFPGSIPGAFIVGLVAYILKKVKLPSHYAALTEPIGTAVIGFLTAFYVFTPFMGHYERWAVALTTIWFGWLISSSLGTAIGFTALMVLKRAKII
ncbi:MAG: energy coupling factor transporter S component ThiW [Sulfolobales archaeon]|nr:energy coupling factor transporter S component ThiW [Sulfolobales archaeon]